MSVPSVDYGNLVENQLPPNRRLPRFKAIGYSFINYVAYLYNYFLYYMNGSIANNYDAGVTYSVGATVVYNFKMYESIQASNTGNAPDGSPLYWMEMLGYFRGANERALYQASKIVFEYALNRYFQTSFAQPPAISDIYIGDVVPTYPTFLVGLTEDESDSIGTTGSSGYITLTESFVTASSYRFIINVPSGLYSSLGSEAEIIIRNFADKYAIVGTTYTIVTY